MKKILISLLIGILKIILFVAIGVEKFFEFFRIFALILITTTVYLFLKAKGDLKNKTMSDIVKDWVYYHSNTFYVDEIQKSYI